MLQIDRSAADVGTLRSMLGGAFVVPGDETWDAVRMPWNVAVDQHPAAVAIPADTDDVVEIVRFARDRGLRVAVQATGHNAAAYATLEGVLLVKLNAMTDVSIDVEGRRVRVEGGALWGDVTAQASPHGLSPLAGSSPDVGVAGYTLGGGQSWLSRKHGLACNSVLAIEVVLADGRLVRATADEHADLFWALRGGGGNFGVVTALELRLFETPEIHAGMMLWPVEHAADVLDAWAAWTETAPDEVTTSIRVMHVPPLPDIPEVVRGRSVVVIDGAYLGGEADAAAALEPLRALAPELDTFAPVEPAALSRIHMDPEGPTPAISAHRMIGELTPEAKADFLRSIDPAAGMLFGELRQLGGALRRTSLTAGALGSFRGDFNAFAVGIPMTSEIGQALRGGLERFMEALSPYDVGSVYLNFAEEPTDAGLAFEPAAYARLRAIKADVDGDDLFLGHHPIKPAF